MSDQRTLTLKEFHADARARFGENPLNWAFQCPSCGDVATGEALRAAIASNPRKHSTGQSVRFTDVLGQECIGRSLGALKGSAVRGCKYAAYGLFPGPWQVTVPGRERPMFCFPLAPAPLAVVSEDGGASS
ncbi:VVA0879 family protein [Streptomyces fagopyri]|uniref:VVA0879 family protein n=1 Tax=Streptomyces fagopyri TaxID=2662397 RepID=UPI0037F3488F